MMEPFESLTGPAAALLQPNIDTDVIIRIERLTDLPRDQLGPYAFESWRMTADGTENPAFILNHPAFRTAPILIAGANFGCGSSREGAVWALQGRGIRCVIAPSFGDIFYANCFQNGMLPVVLPDAAVAALAREANGGAPVTVDLRKQTIAPTNASPLRFDIDARRRESLLRGLDDIELTLLENDEIHAWQARDMQARPWIWKIGNAEAWSNV